MLKLALGWPTEGLPLHGLGLLTAEGWKEKSGEKGREEERERVRQTGGSYILFVTWPQKSHRIIPMVFY